MIVKVLQNIYIVFNEHQITDFIMFFHWITYL